MPKRRYKSQWHRYGSVAGVLLIAIGGVIMILLGVTALADQATTGPLLLDRFLTLPDELRFLWSVLTLICGIIILVIIVKQMVHDDDTLVWVVICALLAIAGGTIGGLIAFGGFLIYIILYFI